VDDPPLVSIVVPMLDEREHIVPCIEGFLAQSYTGELEVLVVDGGSTDGSRELVAAVAATDARVRLLDNPKRLAAAAANVGIASARGDVLCFLSAHGVPDPDYVATSVEVLMQTGAVGVGGRYLHEGTDRPSRAIGLAMASPFGMASPHRTSTDRSEVDTISHPTFRKQPLLDAGGYDETLLRNEDYEFNYRLRAAGGRLVFSPEISSVYRPRGSLRSLGQQFFAYGRWKATVMRRHPASIRPRHLVPPTAVALVGLAPAALLTRRGRRVVATGVAAYAGLEVAALVRARPAAHDASPPVFLASLPVMHGAWGAGVLAGLVADERQARRARREAVR
jgi:glycosyltransferase involved in cell wall biosynthesis